MCKCVSIGFLSCFLHFRYFWCHFRFSWDIFGVFWRFIYNFGWICSRCSSSSADRRRNAADSRYPVTNWRTAAISVAFSLWFNSGCFRSTSALGPMKGKNNSWNCLVDLELECQEFFLNTLTYLSNKRAASPPHCVFK